MKHNRRSFLVGTAGLATLSWIPSRPIRAAGVTEGSLRFIEDFESGSSLSAKLKTSGTPPTVTSAESRSGSRAMRSFLDRQNSNTNYRAEVILSGVDVVDTKYAFFQEFWYGISIKAAPDWQQSTLGEILLQFHDTPVSWDDPGRNPILSIWIPRDSSNWELKNYSNEIYRGTRDTQKLRVNKVLAPVMPGQWEDFVINVRWDYRSIANGGQGFLKVWMNGDLKVDYVGPNCYYDDRGPYVKFGIYKPSWKFPDMVDPVTTRLFFHDEYREADAGGSYELVAPGGQNLTKPNPPQLSASGG